MEQPYLQQVSVNKQQAFFVCFWALDIMLAGEDQSQADQPNSLAEGPPIKIRKSVNQEVCFGYRHPLALTNFKVLKLL
eukprot:1146579-Pelagomonas_calceolata.AAC.1